MPQLKFLHGTMSCGKSSLALQHNYHQSKRGRQGLLITCGDRAGAGIVTSRTGLQADAVDIDVLTDVRWLVESHDRVDYLVVDEAQFLTPFQVEELAWLVDHEDLDVTCVGLTTDFRTNLFEGSKRLLELSDVVQKLQVEGLCWCNAVATQNARVREDRTIISEGETMVIGDTEFGVTDGGEVFSYELLCRKHHLEGNTG